MGEGWVRAEGRRRGEARDLGGRATLDCRGSGLATFDPRLVPIQVALIQAESAGTSQPPLSPPLPSSYRVGCGRVGACRQERAERLEVAVACGPEGRSAAVLQKRRKRSGRGGAVLTAPLRWSPWVPPLSPPRTVSASSVDPPASKATRSAGTSPAQAAANIAPSGAGAWL